MQKLLPYHERVIQADIERARAERKIISANASTPRNISETDLEGLSEHFAEILTGETIVGSEE